MDYVQPVLIPLYRRDFLVGFALIDPEDAEKVQAHKWGMTSAGYALSTGNELMHRFIAEPPDDEVVDHINGSRTDNRRQNLRVCGQQMNMYNTRRQKTKLRGVRYEKRSTSKRAGASITVEGEVINLGMFADEMEAARAYDAAARQFHGEFASLNFPEEMHFEDVDWRQVSEEARAKGPANKRLTAGDREDIRTKYAAGRKQSELASEYGVSRILIYQIVNRISAQESKVSNETLEAAVQRVKNGEALYRVAIEMEIGAQILRRRVKASDAASTPTIYKKRTDAKLSREDVQTILSRVQGGETQKSLAKEFGVSIACVNGYVRGKRRI